MGRVWTNETSDVQPGPVIGDILLVVALSTIPLATAVGNSLVIYAVNTERNLQQVQNNMLVSLAIADLLVAIVVMPISISLEITGSWRLGYVVCDLWRTLDVMACTASILHLCAIALDRYWAITQPVQYEARRTRRFIVQLCGAVWATSLLISLPPITYWRNEGRGPLGKDCGLVDNIAYTVYSAMGSFYVPLALMVVLYIRIYRVAAKRRRQRLQRTKERLKSISAAAGLAEFALQRANGRIASEAGNSKKLSTGISPQVTELTPKTTPEKNYSVERTSSEKVVQSKPVRPLKMSASLPQTSRGSDVSFRLERQNTVMENLERSLSAFKKEKRAARTLGVVMGLFIVCWLPFFLNYLAEPFLRLYGVVSPDWLFKLFTWLGYVNSACNPVIYTIFNKDFRNCFLKIVCRHSRARRSSSC